MKKYLILFFLVLSTQTVRAEEFIMPGYLDDEAYKYCVEMSGDYDNCLKEENQRALRDVKILYKNLLAEQKLMDWNGSFDANKRILQDMYESWTAYRNRLCSLNVVASKYIGYLYDPLYSCTMLQNYNHKEYLTSLLYMLNKDNPKNPYPAELPNRDGGNPYLYISHDETYDSCIQSKTAVAENCLQEEIDRTTQKIKNYISSLASSPMTEKWNNGPDIKNGNYRDMFDSWVAFRNRMCSLTAYVQKKEYGNKAQPLNVCVEFYNKLFSITLLNYLQNSNSVIDEEAPDSDPSDGGAAEGAKITRLTRRIPADDGDSLSSETLNEKTKVQQAETVSAPKNSDSRGRQLPAWAVKQ